MVQIFARPVRMLCACRWRGAGIGGELFCRPSRMRERISAAADTVNVTTSRRRTSPPRLIFSMIRRVSTAVFPDPAAAGNVQRAALGMDGGCCAGVHCPRCGRPARNLPGAARRGRTRTPVQARAPPARELRAGPRPWTRDGSSRPGTRAELPVLLYSSSASSTAFFRSLSCRTQRRGMRRARAQ